MLKIFFLIVAFLFCNLILVLILSAIYSIVNAYIEDITGISLSDRIKNYLADRR